MSEEATLLDAVTVLIERGIYKDRDALLQDALRALLRSKPELRGQLAVALYQRGDVSLTRAAEISGLDIESCKELLREAGVHEVFHQQARGCSTKSSSSCVLNQSTHAY